MMTNDVHKPTWMDLRWFRQRNCLTDLTQRVKGSNSRGKSGTKSLSALVDKQVVILEVVELVNEHAVVVMKLNSPFFTTWLKGNRCLPSRTGYFSHKRVVPHRRKKPCYK